MMFSMAVSDMPKAKAFYVDKLGFKVATDYRKDDDNWWVSLTLAKGGASITLTTAHENMKPGTMKLLSFAKMQNVFETNSMQSAL